MECKKKVDCPGKRQAGLHEIIDFFEEIDRQINGDHQNQDHEKVSKNFTRKIFVKNGHNSYGAAYGVIFRRRRNLRARAAVRVVKGAGFS